MPKPQPWYASLNQPPRNPSNGRNRQPSPSNHSDPIDRADSGTGRPAARVSNKQSIWTTINHALIPLPPAGPGLDLAADAQLILDMRKHIMNQMLSYSIGLIEPPAPPDLPYVGIRSGEITAYRGWVVVDELKGPTLCSLAHHFLWQPNATIEGNLNELVNKSVSNPIFGGVYAFREFDGLNKEIEDVSHRLWPCVRLDNFDEPHTWLGFAYGTVKLWGEVIEHELGYRASFAKLTSIDGFVGVEDNYLLPNLRERYHV